MLKSTGLTVSVLNNSNEVISASDVDWSTVKEGTYFKLLKDTIFYTVAKTQEIYFIKDFQVITSQKIKINTNIGINLINGDTLILSFKEYELDILLGIPNGGIGYKVDDIISLDGGVVSTNIQTGHSEYATFKVLEVNSDGSILSLGLNSKGKYLKCPPGVCSVFDGNGNGAVLETAFILIDDRATFERVVSNIVFENDETIIFLDNPLLKGLENGKLSVEKWKIILSSPYLGQTGINQNFELCRDFSPYYNLPLCAKGGIKLDAIFNGNIVKIDDLIGGLEDRIAVLEEKIKSLTGNAG